MTMIRPLMPSDLGDMLTLEQIAWPRDVQASGAHLKDRINTFADGCLGAWVGDRLAGMATCQIIYFDPAKGPVSWSELCADGWISKTHRPGGNCLHFVSVCVHPDHRGAGIGAALNKARLILGARHGLDLAVTDTRLPGLAGFLDVNPSKSAEDYVEAVLGARLDEPVVMMYLRLGFRPLGLIRSCMKSDIESADYGLAMTFRYGEAPHG